VGTAAFDSNQELDDAIAGLSKECARAHNQIPTTLLDWPTRR
jgi:hypothetical protein